MAARGAAPPTWRRTATLRCYQLLLLSQKRKIVQKCAFSQIRPAEKGEQWPEYHDWFRPEAALGWSSPVPLRWTDDDEDSEMYSPYNRVGPHLWELEVSSESNSDTRLFFTPVFFQDNKTIN